ncbi:MAG: hypothetical protein ACFB0A_12775 [Croceivirga sp.]
MKLKYLRPIVLILMLIFMGCGGSDGDDDAPNPTGGTDDEPEIPAPTASTLIFPEDNSECTTGVINPENETLSTITFEWNASQNTDSYFVTVTDLNSGTSTFANVATNSADITLSRGTPFSWFVNSRAQGTTTNTDSATFRFYNEGPGIENYAPFPAVAVNPTRGQNLSGITSVTLEWSTSDIDDDIDEYEIFFGTDPAALTSLGKVTETNLADISVTAGTTYYWEVITKDAVENTSTSETFEFRIN